MASETLALLEHFRVVAAAVTAAESLPSAAGDGDSYKGAASNAGSARNEKIQKPLYKACRCKEVMTEAFIPYARFKIFRTRRCHNGKRIRLGDDARLCGHAKRARHRE
jgi:hypothetical protein